MSGKARAEHHQCQTQRDFGAKDKNPSNICVSCSCGDSPPPHCVLYKYRPQCCPKGLHAHHVVPVRSFMPPNARRNPAGKRYEGCSNYNINEAPCICLRPGQHRKAHRVYDPQEANQSSREWKYSKASDVGADSVMEATKGQEPPCNRKCVKDQLDAAHSKMGITGNTNLRANRCGPAPLKEVPQGNTGEFEV